MFHALLRKFAFIGVVAALWLLPFPTAALAQSDSEESAATASLTGFYLQFLTGFRCETTGLALRKDTARSRLPQRLSNGFCQSFAPAFTKQINAARNTLLKIDELKDLNRFTVALRNLCRTIVNKRGLHDEAEACFFGLPTPQQPLFSTLIWLYSNGKLSESGRDGSWCFRPQGPQYGDHRDASLRLLFSSANGGSDWANVQRELDREGFEKVEQDSEQTNSSTYSIWPLAVPLNSSGIEDIAIPIPIFSIYHGRERSGQTPDFCDVSNSDCIPDRTVSLLKPDGICVEAISGWGP